MSYGGNTMTPNLFHVPECGDMQHRNRTNYKIVPIIQNKIFIIHILSNTFLLIEAPGVWSLIVLDNISSKAAQNVYATQNHRLANTKTTINTHKHTTLADVRCHWPLSIILTKVYSTTQNGQPMHTVTFWRYKYRWYIDHKISGITQVHIIIIFS